MLEKLRLMTPKPTTNVLRLPQAFALATVLGAILQAAPAPEPPLRPPAVPLVTHDPYLSIWSANDRLTDGWPTHWTGTTQAMCGLIRIDGHPYRFMGGSVGDLIPMQQTRVEVMPTRTIYEFIGSGVKLQLTFLSPLLPENLDLLSRPVSYLTWTVQSTDNASHQVSIYFDCTAELAVDKDDQKVTWAHVASPNLDIVRLGSEQQGVLARAGDNLRIDWGYLYLALPKQGTATARISSADSSRNTFRDTGNLPAADDQRMPRAARDDWPVLCGVLDLGKVGATPVSRHLLLGYDDLFSIEYMGKQLRPYWRRNGLEAVPMLQAAESDYEATVKLAEKFDKELMIDLRRRGGEQYARLCALAYRQCIAAHKVVAGPDGKPLMFPKENFSNGCISTVDVFYPSAPFFLLFSPPLLEAQMRPIMDYASSPRWNFPFAPHDLGTYPKANGQVYGGGEKNERDQMPVEESGNMLLLAAALAKAEGNANFSQPYWPILTRWAEYLKDKGLDPENQLCTDYFAGHLAHNANLSVKAVLAIGAYSFLCDTLDKKEEAAKWKKVAQDMAKAWPEKAADGDHYRLAFDRPGTWSMKYNLVWDTLLGFNIFSPEISQKEIAFYKTKMNRYGLPLDNRKDYTKSDWLIWTASLAEEQSDFKAFVAPLYRFANESPSRVPFTDWYSTVDARQSGFQARSVIGGIYIPVLAEWSTWMKWAERAGK